MAKSLPQILEQIERLQREAQTMQSQVIKRIRKEIEHYQLKPEHLFGEAGPAGRVAKAIRTTSRAVAKYADDLGNTWGGMGKRPNWLRQALDAGRQLEEFLVGKQAGGAKPASKAAAKKRGGPRKAAATTAATPAAEKPAAKKPAAKKAAAKKAAAKPGVKKAAGKARAAGKTATQRIARKRAGAAPSAEAASAA